MDEIKVGDIYYATWGVNVSLPMWVKVVGKTAKRVKCVELEERVVSGHYNGSWYSVPTDKVITSKPVTCMVTDDGYIRFNGHYSTKLVRKWDGKPMWCNDMD